MADIIYLRNGNQVQGEIVRRGGDSITVRFPGGFLEIPSREVVRVESESRLDYLLSEGEKHLKRKDFEGALDFLESARAEFPSSTRVYQRIDKAREELAFHLADTRRLERAEEALEKLLVAMPNHPTAAKRLESVRRERETARREEALGIRELAEGATASGHRRLKKIYDEYPGRRHAVAPYLASAVADLADAALEQGDLTRAERLYMEAITLVPDLLPRVVPGYVLLKAMQLKPLFDLNHYEPLLAGTDAALEVVPSSPVLNYFRAHALEGLGRWREAAEIYLRITGESRPPDLRAALPTLKRLAEAVLLRRGDEEQSPADEVLPGTWRVVRTEHFVVHHRNERIGREVAQVAEATYDRLFGQLELKTHWYSPCELYIHPDRDDFAGLTDAGHGWIGGSHRISGGRGALSVHRIDTFQTQPRLAQTVIPHEVGHAMLTHRLRYRGTIPLWINEGFATWNEPRFVHDHHQRLVRQAAQLNALIPVTELVRRQTYPSDADVRLFYAQCFSVSDFLIRMHGLRRFMSFAEELSLSPTSLGLLLRRHYRLNGAPGLDHAWQGSIRAR